MSIQPAWTRSAVLADSSVTPQKLAAGSVTSRSLGGRERLRSFMSAMASTRVDIVALGDSNQLYSGTGWDHGFQSALTALGVPMYATGLLSLYENDGLGAATGYTYNVFPYAPGASSLGSTAPGALGAAYTVGEPHGTLYVEEGQSLAASAARGLILLADSALDVSARLRFHFSYGTFASGSGAMQPAVRVNQSPFTVLVRSTQISANTGTVGVAIATLDLAAAARTTPLLASPALPGGATDIVGPIGIGWVRAENRDRRAGFAYSTMLAAGGWSLRDMLDNLQSGWTDEALVHYFTMLRSTQFERKRFVFAINSGVNDRNEGSPSLGPAPVADGDSPEAYADNLRGIVARIEDVWVAQGWSLEELCFMVTPSHPVSDPNDAELLAYRQAAEDVAVENGRVSVVAFDDVADEDTFVTLDWYLNSATDRNHLKQAGYEQAATTLLASTSDVLAARSLGL